MVVNPADCFGVDRGTHGMHYVRVSTLKERLEQTLQKSFDGNQSAWSLKAGLARAAVRKLLTKDGTNEGSVELGTLEALARAAGVSATWLAFGEGEPDADPLIGQFLIALGEKPGLRETINANLSRWRTSTIARATVATFDSTSDGVPNGGWAKALDTLESRGKTIGTASDVTRATVRQIGRRRALPKGSS